MRDARQPLATRFRARQPMSNLSVTIYEAKFREKLTKYFLLAIVGISTSVDLFRP